jgi:hypothetical protein
MRTACIGGAIAYRSGMSEHDTPAEWVEAEIQPADYGRRERLLVDVIDPLVHETLDGRIDAWHYFWEPALRFRVHWQQPILKRDPDDALTEFTTGPDDNALREFHWVHAVHLFTNPLGLFHLDEGRSSLRHASQVFAIARRYDPVTQKPQVVDVLQAIADACGELDAKVHSLRGGSTARS